MASLAASQLLARVLPQWRRRLRSWAADGRLEAAAQQALRLPEEALTSLQALLQPWARGDFSTLPTVQLLPEAAINGARGAYAASNGTIYLNRDWLTTASGEQVIAVLSEELGHHLDARWNGSDTPGDEGELLATLLLGDGAPSAKERQRLQSEADHGWVWLEGNPLAVEQATQLISTPIPQAWPGRTAGEVGNDNAFAVLKADGSVVTWGDAGFGGDSSAVSSRLASGVTQIFSNSYAFAALEGTSKNQNAA